ncbi:MAG TPA: hypothetical protein VFB00_04555 [Terriglobales bacterium]|nr:hypothetical protein [Terriglobales bacterium]
MKRPASSGSETLVVAQLAAAVSIAAFFYHLRHDNLLLYGDAVAHINIARRVFDSQTPGPLQLGTVWLPLPHLLMLPFLVPRWLWQTGIGGSIPSLIAYVFSVMGTFRLVRTVLPAPDGSAEDWISGFAAWLAAGVFALNPNLIYLQTTAMTEPLYLAFFIWALVFLSQAVRGGAGGEAAFANSSLVKSGCCVLAGCLTRYDGWFLAALIAFIAILLAWIGGFPALRPGVKNLVLLAAAGPILWLGYNAAIYRNPLEFANGPYSARAIEQKTAVAGQPPHPGTNNLPLAFRYFFKAAELNLAPSKMQVFWAAALLLGTAIVLLFQRKLWPLLILWAPVPFYMLSIAYSGVPVFLPVWWPFSFYNTRYGVEMLPAFAALSAAGAYGLIRFAAGGRARTVIAAVFLGFPGASYLWMLRSTPVSFEEAVVNARTRVGLEKQMASILEAFPADSRFVMYLGDHVGAFQRAGIPLEHVINEGNHRPWKQPRDPQGLWEKALDHPAAYADYVVAFAGDAVANAVNKSELESVIVVHVTGQPEAIIYRTVKSNQAR